MIRAVLLDLDDTLLRNDMAGFLPTYLRSLGEALADLVDPGRLAAEVMAGTRDMLINQDPRRTWLAALPPLLPGLKQTRRHASRLRDYYSECSHRPADPPAAYAGRRRLVQALQRASLEQPRHQPLFPRLAVEHRLAWAGLPVDRHSLARSSTRSCIPKRIGVHRTARPTGVGPEAAMY
jgi:hypothetical protein